MQKCIDYKEYKAKKRIHQFIQGFALEDVSFSKFINSIRLHAMALHSDSVENQLLNLWIALESLIPTDTKQEDAANITHIVQSLTPFLNILYFYDLIANIFISIIRMDRTIMRKAITNVEGDNVKIKFIKLLVMEQYSNQFQQLLKDVGSFYLLKDRIEFFHNLFSSKSNIKNSLDIHTQRLEWQIRRIYRTRNLIVHTGFTPHYTNTLIEHTHNYLDRILELLIFLASKPNKIHSVGQGFDYINLLYLECYSIIAPDKANKKANSIPNSNDKFTEEELIKFINILGKY